MTTPINLPGGELLIEVILEEDFLVYNENKDCY